MSMLFPEILFPNSVRILGSMPLIMVGGYNTSNIRFADDTTLIAAGLHEILDTVMLLWESEKKGLTESKTVMLIQPKIILQICSIWDSYEKVN